MNSEHDAHKQIDKIDVLFLLWILLLSMLWISPALETWAGKWKILLNEVILLAGVIGYLKYQQLPVKAVCRWNSVPVVSVGLFVLLAISGAILLDGLDRIVGLIIPLSPETKDALTTDLTSTNAVERFSIIVGMGIAAPFVEETIFRGAIQNAFERTSGITKGILTTALIFSLIHVQISWLIQLLVMSVLLGWLAWRWNSIMPALLLHSANNVLSYFLLIEADEEFKGFYLFHEQLNPIIALVAIAVAYLSTKRLVTIRNQFTQPS